MKIYVAGAYSGKTPKEIQANVNRAIDAGIEIMQRGHEAMVPHLTHWFHLRALSKGTHFSYARWMKLDVEILAGCDAILRLPGQSKGADMELEWAKKAGLIVFKSLNEVPITPQMTDEEIFASYEKTQRMFPEIIHYKLVRTVSEES